MIQIHENAVAFILDESDPHDASAMDMARPAHTPDILSSSTNNTMRAQRNHCLGGISTTLLAAACAPCVVRTWSLECSRWFMCGTRTRTHTHTRSATELATDAESAVHRSEIRCSVFSYQFRLLLTIARIIMCRWCVLRWIGPLDDDGAWTWTMCFMRLPFSACGNIKHTFLCGIFISRSHGFWHPANCIIGRVASHTHIPNSEHIAPI